MGGRLLRSWIQHPLIDKGRIIKRQNVLSWSLFLLSGVILADEARTKTDLPLREVTVGA